MLIVAREERGSDADGPISRTPKALISTDLAEVNTAVNQMDQFTQQNAAMVEQSAAASHSLSQETEELTRVIGPLPDRRRREGGVDEEGTASARRVVFANVSGQGWS
jgi:hypothetical protein